MKAEVDWEQRLRLAVKEFWMTRARQAKKQGEKSGTRDAGNRTAVTGGKQMSGFVDLLRDFVIDCGIDEKCVFCNRAMELPGWFRAEKNWDLLVIVEDKLIAAMELKSHVGSFGNNFNNRTEESIGSATDIWTAYREGAFAPSQRPWAGYLMMVEDVARTHKPVKVREPHFPVFSEFRGASYAKRYEIMMTKLLRERLYDAAALVLSNENSASDGRHGQPSQELAFGVFLSSLRARLITSAGVAN